MNETDNAAITPTNHCPYCQPVCPHCGRPYEYWRGCWPPYYPGYPYYQLPYYTSPYYTAMSNTTGVDLNVAE